MKIPYAFLSIVIFIIISCKKGTSEPPPYVNKLSAKVNGHFHKSENNNYIKVLFSLSPVVGARSVGVYAKNLDGHELYLLMDTYDGTVKTFTDGLNNPSAIGGFSLTQGLYNTSYSTIGEIQLTSIDKDTYEEGDIATGTFHFDTDTTAGFFKVTEGSFSLFISHRDY